MATKTIRLKTLSTAVLAVALVEVLGTKILHLWDIPALVLLGCLRLLDIAILIWVVIGYEKSTLHIGLDPAGIRTGIRKGVWWSLAFGLFAVFLALMLYFFDIDPLRLIRTPLPKNLSETVLYVIVGGVVSPMAEEIFFRGIVFLFFRQWGFVAALVVSTAFFTLLHPLSSGIPLPQIVGGLLFATAFEVEKNLLTPAVIHISGNLAIFAISWLNMRSII